MEPRKGTGRRQVPHPPPRKSKANPLPWIIGGAVVLIAGGILLFKPGDPPPAPPPEIPKKVARTDPPPPAPPTPPPPAPPDPGPEEPAARLKWIARMQAGAPAEFKRWHGELSALLARAKGTPLESSVSEEIERLEAAAHKEFRAVFRPVREKINALLEERKGRAAVQVLKDWKLPDAFTFSDTIRADLEEEVGRLSSIASIDEIVDSAATAFHAGQDPGDPREKLAPYLKSPDISIRMPAEYALRKVRFLVVAREFRLAMDGRRTEAENRIASLRKDLGTEAEARRKRIETWEKRLQEATKAAPLSAQALGLTGTMTFRILKFDGNILTYGNASVEMKASLLSLKPASIGRLLELAIDPRDPEGLLEAGRTAIRVGALDAADRLVRSAVKQRPAFEATAPSMERIRRGVGSLRGKAEVVGDRVAITYAFDDPEEASDIRPLGKSFVDVRGGNLHLSRGNALFYADVGNADFSGSVRLRLKTAGIEGNAAHVFGFRWEVSPGESDLLLAVVLSNAVRILHWEGDKDPKVRKEIPVDKPWSDYEFSLAATRFELRGAGAPIWSESLSASGAVRAVVGGVAVNDSAQAGVAFAHLDLEGRGAPDWIRSMRSERRALIEGELSKELKVLASSGTKFNPGRDFGSDLVLPLPAEERFVEAFTPDAKRALADYRRRIGEYFKASRSDDLSFKAEQVLGAIDIAIKESPWLPLGYYYRAEWKYMTGDLDGALADLAESLARHANFVEAHLARAEVLQQLWRYEEAGKSIDTALERIPDLAQPRLTRALLLYYGDRFDEATQELGLAMRLAPEDLGLRLAALRLERVLAGPRWAQEIRIDTPNYHVRVEQAAGNPKEAAAVKDRADRASKILEIARAWFVESVGGDVRRLRKPLVYLFQSPESYYVHAELAHGNRLEHSLGVFFPLYQQLSFFLGGGTEEEVFATMVHEAFHEYIRSVAGDVPIWFNEGYAEYASSAVIENGKVTSAGGMLADRSATLKRALKGGFKGIPFKRIMTESHSQFMTDAAVKYAQAWSMIHFMKHSGNASYKAALDAYMEGLLKRTPPGKNLETAFKGIDFNQMQHDWWGYVSKW